VKQAGMISKVVGGGPEYLNRHTNPTSSVVGRLDKNYKIEEEHF